jgi:DNA-binding beta-propeller fold protein YncE
MLSKKIWVGVSCLVLVAVLVSPAPGQTRPSDPPRNVPLKSSPPKMPFISTIPAYQAVLIADGLGSPRGIGAFPERGRVLFNTEDDYRLWYFNLGTLQAVPIPPDEFQASRYNGGYFVGDDSGYIYQLKDGVVLETLAWVPGAPGYITGLDVDPVTRSIYVIDYDSVWVLPKGQTVPVLLKNLGFSSWGIGVRGNYLYISDFDNNRLWRMPKKGGNLTLYVSGLNGPSDVVADPKGNLFIAEGSGGSVAKIPAKTTKIKRIAWGMSWPYYLGLDSQGDVCVSDFVAGTVWMLMKK